jgi:GDP-L-fucose synthase
MTDNNFWQTKRVCVTGGAGFLGKVVVRKLQERGVKDVFIPAIENYDLVKMEDIDRMLKDANADLIIHLAAQVGGIGANREHPAEFYNNLMMGVQLMHRAWKPVWEKWQSVLFALIPSLRLSHLMKPILGWLSGRN